VDSFERAQVRLWTKAVDEELHPACSALTYTISHRHTILRNGIGGFEEFLAAGSSEGRVARERKWGWLQQGLAAPGIGEQFRIYVGFLERMELALAAGDWLVGQQFSMADIALSPYVNRLNSLALSSIWADGRLQRVGEWFGRVRARPAFAAAFERWMPETLAAEMRATGERAWPEVLKLLS
jgi:glutathione S-transferase